MGKVQRIPEAISTPDRADQVLGRRRKSVPLTAVEMDWSNCPMAQRYPTWEMYWASLDEERQDASATGRLPHPATKAKFEQEHPGRPTPTDLAPKEDVSSAAVIRRAYGTKD